MQKTNLRPIALSIKQAGHMLGLGRTLLYSKVASGELKVVKVGRRTLVPVKSIEDFLSAAQGATGGAL